MAASPNIVLVRPDRYPWFAVRVKSSQELLAAQALRGKSYESFVPTYPQRRRYSDRCVQVDRALFPGYVFCRFDPFRRLPILTTPTVQSIVSFNKVPHPVEEHEIAALQQIVRSGLLAKPWPYLKAGQRIRIEEGPLSGVQGILCKEKGKDQLVVSVDLLQRSVSVQIERFAIRPA